MKLFLDDVRDAPEGWTLVRPDNISYLMENAHLAEAISFDHDLGEMPNGEQYSTGYDILTKLEALVRICDLWKGRPAPELTIHSANPVGVGRMKIVISNIYRYLEAN